MSLSRVEIYNIRNLRSVSVDLNPIGFNGLYGANASGKTSFLEAIYILGRGTSFRSKELSRALQDEAQRFRIIGRLEPRNVPMSVEFQAHDLQFRIGRESVRSRTELVNQLPLLFINPESHALISEGPQQRRRFLDWGVFHVEHGFLSTWRRYQRVLKQRNKALRMPGMATAWDKELVASAEQITNFRRAYVLSLEPYIYRFIHLLVDVEKVSMHLSPGWRQDLEYADILRDSLEQDREYGFTRHGPHRADIIFKVGGRFARDTLSRGQQKLLVIALLLAQIALLNENTYICPIILIDDLVSELDAAHRQRLLSVLSTLKAQVILTVTEKRDLAEDNDIPIRWFHVEQGKITPWQEPKG